MAGVRRGARAVLKYFLALYVVAVIVQIFLAGEGIFGADGSPTDDDQSPTLDAHRGLGWIMTEPVAFLLLVTALLAWLPNKRDRTLSIVLPFILWIQLLLPSGGRWVAAFHPLNAILILGLLGYLTRRLWRPTAEEPVATTV
ncbi:MAG TPA: hypothetical protein VGQ15_09740 [Gaiellaceae bacterium]|jgi:hypothetical protein|nr:hypothetical protein [Gaiellaceae bacterium]